MLPMVAEKLNYMEDEVARMERIRARKARKHKIDDWEDKEVDTLSDVSDEEAKKDDYPSDIPSSKYE
jgi:hypothetical protein